MTLSETATFYNRRSDVTKLFYCNLNFGVFLVESGRPQAGAVEGARESVAGAGVGAER